MGVDQIGTKGLVDCSVAAVDIADGTITNAKLAGSIANDKLSNNSITVNGQSISLGASSGVPPVQWQSVVASDGSTVTTMVAGRGYFINNTSAAGIVKLPLSASAGDLISIKDYAGNFGTNNLTIQRNGHNIQGVANDSLISTNRASLSLVYVDATKGWLYTNESNVAELFPTFISATGGTVTTTGDFKVHTFTGDGCFVVSSIGNCAAGDSGTKVDYLVIAGGASGGSGAGGGGGAGGFRESKDSGISSPHTASPLANTTGLTVSATTFPVTVGGGGASTSCGARGQGGSNSVFSTITSAGGGEGGIPSCGNGGSGGSGGGAASTSGTGGSGNTPPVSPPQGNNGSPETDTTNLSGAGGGGATGTGNNNPDRNGGPGGTGGGTAINSSCSVGTPGPSGSLRYYSGGGAGGAGPAGGGGTGGYGGGGPGGGEGPGTSGTAGTTNTGGGGGGGGRTAGSVNNPSGAGGSGVVIIRYKYQ